MKFSKYFPDGQGKFVFLVQTYKKNGTDRVDFPILKIPEWYFLQCTEGPSAYRTGEWLHFLFYCLLFAKKP